MDPIELQEFYEKIVKPPYYDKDYTWYEVNFSNIIDLYDYLKSDPLVNRGIFRRCASIKGDKSFHGEPLDEAIEYLLGGYEENLENLFELKNELESALIFPSNKRIVTKSVTGSRICPNSFISNSPKKYYKRQRIEEKHFVNIHANLSYLANQDKEQILNKGALLLNLINILEENNYSVTLNSFFLSKCQNELSYIKVNLKNPGMPLNPSGAIFPFTSRSFLRRLIFRVRESQPFLVYEWGDTYGSTVDGILAKKLLNLSDDDIYIGTPREMGIDGYDLIKDASNFLEYTDINKYVRVRINK